MILLFLVILESIFSAVKFLRVFAFSGSGPAAQKAAINAAKLKKHVAIVDTAAMLGGVCLHTGTIPSKTFREAVMFLTGYRERGFYNKSYLPRVKDICAGNILERVSLFDDYALSPRF